MSPLETLLDQVRAALVGGDLAALAGLEDAMLAAADTVSLLDPQAIRRVKRKAERNAQLLQAANRGLRAARTRMAEIATGPGLSIYDSRGRTSSLAGSAAALGRF